MKERLLEELQKGSKGAVMKKHIITYLILYYHRSCKRYGLKYTYCHESRR